MYFTLVGVIMPSIEKSEKTFKNIALIAGTQGAIIYGIYNATNMAVFSNYKLSTAIMDTLWGMFMYTTIATILVYWI